MATVKEDSSGKKRVVTGSREGNMAFTESILTNPNIKKSMPRQVLKGDLKCDCCPYGYHIDLDFVNYCEELYNGTYHQNLKRLYRDHRKHKKLPEHGGFQSHYLGKPRSKSSDPPLLKSPTPDYSENYHERWLPTHPHHSHLHIQKSPTKEVKVPPSDILTGQKPLRAKNNGDCTDGFPSDIHVCTLPPTDMQSSPSVLAASHSRSDSNSSLSSTSTECSTNLQILNSPTSKCTCGSQQIADTMATLNSASVINNGLPVGYVGINTNVLSTIRSQVATSLHRMKELEEQAKAVPILQVKLSVLKEEKRLLMLQLKHKDLNSKQKVFNTGENNVDETDNHDFLQSSTLPKFRKPTFSGTSLEKRGIPLYSSAERLSSEFDDAFEKNNAAGSVNFNSFQQIFRSNETAISLKKLKNVGTNCTVLTRDIGVGHIAERLKSVGIGDEPALVHNKKCSKCGGPYNKSNIYFDSLSSSEFAEDELEEEKKVANRPDVLKHEKHIQKTVEVAEKATHCGLGFLSKPVLTCNKREAISIPPAVIRCPKCEERSLIQLKNVASQSKLINCMSFGINTDKVVLKNTGTSIDIRAKSISFGINTDNVASNDSSLITELSMKDIDDLQLNQIKQKQTKDKGTGIPRPILGHAKTQTVTNTRDSSTSVDFESCNVSIQATLPFSSENKNKEKIYTQAKKLSAKGTQTDIRSNTVDASCGNCSIHDTFCDRCELRQTETIGVGSIDVSDVLCDRCKNVTYVDVAVGSDKPPVSHSVGINTSERLTLEAAPTSGVHICDKCNAKIKSVAKDLVDKNTDNVFHPAFAQKLKTSFAEKSESACIVKGKVEKRETEHISEENNNVVIQEKKLSRKETLTKLVVSKRTSEHTGSGSETTDSSDSQSADSPDEKLYDGILSRIISRHRNNVSLDVQSAEQITRKKAEMSEEMKKACQILNESLTSKSVSEKELSSAMEVIQKEWFHVSSKKHSDPHVVEDYLDAFEEISKHLLHTIVNLKDANGNTAMHYSVSHGNFDVVSVLLDSKVCDANIQNNAGYTSVMLISLAEIKNEAHKHVVQRLFQINEINLKAAQNGQTALMLAASQGRTEAVKLLLECGAEINMQDKDGSTALMCAAEHGHADVVHVLLAHPDCEATLVDNDGSSALSIAMEVGHRDVALMIYAKVNFSRGNSPYSSLRTRRTKTSSSSRSSLPPHGSPATPPRTPPPPSPRPRKNSSSF